MLETGKIGSEMSWLEQPRTCPVWEHRTVRWCTGQCPVRQAGSSKVAALGTSTAVYDYNSPDCPVCTGLSGEPTVGRANGRPRNPRATRGRANGRKGALDCPVCTGLSGVPTAPRSATVGCAILGRRSGTGQCPVCTGLSGAPDDRRQGWPSCFALNGS